MGLVNNSSSFSFYCAGSNSASRLYQQSQAHQSELPAVHEDVAQYGTYSINAVATMNDAAHQLQYDPQQQQQMYDESGGNLQLQYGGYGAQVSM